MSTFILIDADSLSYLVCTLFVAASLFAMQTLNKNAGFYNWWSAAFAIGGLRYFITYLVSMSGLHVTVFILDLLFIAQGLLMLQGILVMQDRQQPVWLILTIGFVLSIWGYIASSLSFSWAMHDIPILGFYSLMFIFSGISCIKDASHGEIPASIRVPSSALIAILGLFYLLLMFLRPENNLRWIFVAEQGLLVALGIMLVFAILHKLQQELHKAADVDVASGAYTRKYFFSRIDEELKRAQRYHRPFSMLLLRIDRFSEMTESLDKKQLDSVLRLFYDNICNALRDIDFTGLTNQGEFAIALPETDIEEARHVAERQLYRSKKLSLPAFEGKQNPLVYITVLKCEASDSAESIYLRAKKIIDDKMEDGIHPLFY